MRNAVVVSTIVTAAESYDLIDLATLKTLLGVTTTQWDEVFALWITQASTAAQTFTGNPFVIEAREDQVWPRKDGVPWTVRPDLDALELARWPITSAVSPAATRPPMAPALYVTPGGSLAAAAYTVALTYVTPYGETPCGPPASIACAAGQVFTIGAPGVDRKMIASGFNIYAGPFGQALTQQASGVAVGQSWTLPGSGLVEGSAPPSSLSLVEKISGVLTPLGAGLDFLLDPEVGKIYRLDDDLRPKDWAPDPVTANYSAGYATIPPDVFDAVVQMVKIRWYAQTRDPMIRQSNIEGVASTSYWFASGPGADTDMPPDVQAKLERYRIPQFA